MHDPRLPGLRVEVSETRGRRVVAARNFEAGEVVLCTVPLSCVVLPSAAMLRCGSCFSKLAASNRRRCSRCRSAWYCDQACHRADWAAGHRYECGNGDRVEEMLSGRLERNMNDDVRAMLKWASTGTTLRDQLLSASERNHFCVTDEMLEPIAAAASPLGALLNHSCLPTCVVSYSVGHGVKQHFIAVRHIAAGEEVTHSYVDCGMPTAERKARLRKGYGFDCDCERCQVDDAQGDAPDAVAAARRLLTTALLATDPDDEASLLERALAAIQGRVKPHHHVLVDVLQAMAQNDLARGHYDAAAASFEAVANARNAIHRPLPHPRVALDFIILRDVATLAGRTALADTARRRARSLVLLTTAPDSPLRAGLE